jgi:Cu+-exporting ATPase
MTISPEDAVGHVHHEGETYYFCNPSCLEKFKADPTQYIADTKKASSPELHHDPVCGMNIAAEDAAGTVLHKGHRYYFCSNSCVEKFKAGPEKYLKPKQATPPAPGSDKVEYTCPHGPGSAPAQSGNMPQVRNGT